MARGTPGQNHRKINESPTRGGLPVKTQPLSSLIVLIPRPRSAHGLQSRGSCSRSLNSQKHGGCPGFRCCEPGSWGKDRLFLFGGVEGEQYVLPMVKGPTAPGRTRGDEGDDGTFPTPQTSDQRKSALSLSPSFIYILYK